MELKLTFTEKQTAESSPESSIVRQIYRTRADMHCYWAFLLWTAYDSRHLRWVLPRTRVLLCSASSFPAMEQLRLPAPLDYMRWTGFYRRHSSA